MKTKFVLIVDDEFGLAEVMADLLGDEGYETAVANDGRLGLQMLQERVPDLLFLDVMMPNLDGVGVLCRMRQMDALAEVPVVLMTALRGSLPTDDPPKHQAVLIKPFTHDELFTVARALL